MFHCLARHFILSPEEINKTFSVLFITQDDERRHPVYGPLGTNSASVLFSAIFDFFPISTVGYSRYCSRSIRLVHLRYVAWVHLCTYFISVDRLLAVLPSYTDSKLLLTSRSIWHALFQSRSLLFLASLNTIYLRNSVITHLILLMPILIQNRSEERNNVPSLESLITHHPTIFMLFAIINWTALILFLALLPSLHEARLHKT